MKPFNPCCEKWQWLQIDGKEKIARCNHPKNKGGDCIKGKCPKGEDYADNS